MSSEQITNGLIRLYDGNHGSIHTNYAQYSPDAARGAAIYVNWYDAWCLSVWLHGRLATEREWEYACRARPGATDDVPHFTWHFGDREADLGNYAWTWENCGDSEYFAHPVGQKLANPWGLFDMHGNVLEWCAEWWADDARTSRVLRGGSF